MATTFAVPDGRVAMAATTYTGTGATLAVSNAVNTVSFQPDLVWTKTRNTATNGFNIVQDSVRGAGYRLITDGTYAEGYDATFGSFTSSGFQFGTNANVNTNANTYINWQWKAGGTAVSNTAGTITSSVSANTTAGFSVVTYTGTGANATVGHGLGVAPSMVIVKNRSSGVDGWPIYHVGLTSATFFIKLNSTDAQASAASIWNSTSPTLSVFSVGTSTGTNQSANAYVAYCWAPVAGYSAFGSYTGNGSADGPFIYTGFRPRYFLTKRTDLSGTRWIVMDTSRNPANVADLILSPNYANAELSNPPYLYLDFVSNGLKIRGYQSGDTEWNAPGGTYIYAAFAESAFKFSNAR